MLHTRGSVLTAHFPGLRVSLHFDRASAAPNVNIINGGTTAEFDKDGAYRCVFTIPGFEVGIHSWTIIWLKPGCCGNAGVPLETLTFELVFTSQGVMVSLFHFDRAR